MSSIVNVVIPVYKPDEKLIRLVTMLDKQTEPVEKIIFMQTVISSDVSAPDKMDRKTTEMLEKLANDISVKTKVVKVTRTAFDHGNTRRQGAANVSDGCEYVLFMTQDAVPENEHLIENLLKPFSDDKVAAAYARQVATSESTLSEKFTRGFNYPDEDRIKTVEDIETIGIKAFFCSNVCAIYKKSVYDKLGGFVKKTIFNEDMIFANKILKSGYCIAYASKATVIHTHDYTGKQQYKRNFDLAVSQVLNPQAFKGVSSESEGVKYVKAAAIYFAKHKKPWLIIPFGINCVYKLLGYKKGKKIETLSEKEIRKCTSNQGFFDGVPMDGTIVEYVMKLNGIEYKD